MSAASVAATGDVAGADIKATSELTGATATITGALSAQSSVFSSTSQALALLASAATTQASRFSEFGLTFQSINATLMGGRANYKANASGNKKFLAYINAAGPKPDGWDYYVVGQFTNYTGNPETPSVVYGQVAAGTNVIQFTLILPNEPDEGQEIDIVWAQTWYPTS